MRARIQLHSECKKLAQKEYERACDNVARIVSARSDVPTKINRVIYIPKSGGSQVSSSDSFNVVVLKWKL